MIIIFSFKAYNLMTKTNKMYKIKIKEKTLVDKDNVNFWNSVLLNKLLFFFLIIWSIL